VLKLITAFSSSMTTQTVGDYAARIHLRVNPKSVGLFCDSNELAGRLQQLLDAELVPEAFLPAVKQFVREVRLMKAGKDPDAIGFLDD
jgi:hypothetical protein